MDCAAQDGNISVMKQT